MTPKISKCKYYQEHKADILADLRQIGIADTAKKWDMPKSTAHGLAKRWLTQSTTIEPAAPTPQPRPGLPELPNFSDQWTPLVQAKWLEVYQALATLTTKSSPNGARDGLELTRTG